MKAQPTEVHRVAAALRRWSLRFDTELERRLGPESRSDAPARLMEAMRYTILAPGKRLRPYLTCACCGLVGGEEADALSAAVAIECVHAFSLIHDDLPSMDDDVVRRGQPSNHVRFGEGLAILAGDALLVLAFETLASDSRRPELAGRTVGELARACGWMGMIGGQADDIDAAGGQADDVDAAGGQGDDVDAAPRDQDKARLQSVRPPNELGGSIRARKTGRLMEAACRLGAICGSGDEPAIESLGRYGLELGIAFQMADDLLDVSASAAGPGVMHDLAVASREAKPASAAGVRSVAVEHSAGESMKRAVSALAAWGSEADDLRAIARFVVERRN